jgi:drug/metabolite transporter (DMT)-like permease
MLLSHGKKKLPGIFDNFRHNFKTEFLLILLGLVGMAVFQLISAISLGFTAPINVSIVSTLGPLLIFFASVLFGKLLPKIFTSQRPPA